MLSLMSSLMIAVGALAVGLGVLMARAGLRIAHRRYARTARIADANLDEWGAWFLGGFSTMTLGFRGLIAVIAWCAWTLIGVSCLGLGIQLLGRW